MSEKLNITVLFVDDEPEIRTFMVHTIGRLVQNVIPAGDGQEALELFLQHKPDIVITDIRMPKMDGLELTGHIKQASPQTPVLVTTAHSETQLLVDAIRLGVDEIIFKPVDTALIGRFLQKHAKIIQANSEIQRLETIHESERLLRNVADSVTAMIWKSDESGQRILFNKAWSNFTGLEFAQNIRHTWTKAVHPLDLRSLLSLQELSFKDGRPYTTEYRLKRFDGEYRIIQESTAPLVGDTKAFVGSCMDITDLKSVDTLKGRVDQEVKRRIEQENMLIQQSKLAAMGEMIGAIAHQWRQPLAAISSAAMNMSMKKSLGTLTDEMFTRILSDIENHTQRMSKTINDFMNFSKPDKQKQQFCVHEAIDDVCGLLKSQFSSREIEIVNDTPTDIVFDGYKNELEQVLLNIFINARDAFEGQSLSKTIKVLAFGDKEFTSIVIQDNAGGIDDTILERIFEPYFTTKEEGRGTGIGLYMSKSIMQKSFGGDLTAQNIYEGNRRMGAQFSLRMR